MGAILDADPDAGVYRVEIRGESAYLMGEDTYEHQHEGQPAPLHAIRSRREVGFAVLVGDRPQVVAALRQITQSARYIHWMKEHEPVRRFVDEIRGSLVYL